ncbi:MAG: zf-TFIIB domain-containing protein [Deltaproteobacteria bacterium]|nr:zf-TFIIB domain-containing protein [Deltaproteobacteria bacterium]
MAHSSEDRKTGLADEDVREQAQEAVVKTRYRGQGKEQEQPTPTVALRCPKCEATLEDMAFQEIQVERCTGCRGIWLDAGELEQITARETEGWLSHFWRSSKGH